MNSRSALRLPHHPSCAGELAPQKRLVVHNMFMTTRAKDSMHSGQENMTVRRSYSRQKERETKGNRTFPLS